MISKLSVVDSWPVLARHEKAAEWLQIWSDLGHAARTIDAYGRGLSEFLTVCDRDGVDPVAATKADVALFVRDLTERPHRRGANVVAIDSGAGLSNATIQQRLVPVRLGDERGGALAGTGRAVAQPRGDDDRARGGRGGGDDLEVWV